MASTYSTNLKIELIGTGDQSGTWGATTNTNLGTLLEQAIAGYATQAVTDSGVATVLTIPDGTSSTGRNYVIALTGALTANRTVEVPAVNKPYIFFNNTTGGFSVTVKVSGQTGVTIANGKKAIVYTNSTDVIEVANAPATEAGTQTLTNKTLTTPLIATVIGGTTASSSLTLQSTSGVGTSDSISLQTGSQQTRMSIDTSGNVGIATGNLTFSGTGQRITGDFSNATFANRLAFQTSTSNSNTNVYAIPNGTGVASGWNALNNPDPTNASYIRILINSTSYTSLESGKNGTGTYLPMTFYTGGSEAMRIGATSGTDLGTVGIGYSTLTGVGTNGLAVLGNVGIGTSSPGYKLDVVSASDSAARFSVGNKVIDGTGNVQIFTTNAQSTDVGGSLALGGKNGSAGAFDPWAFGVIKGAKENSTSGNFAGYLTFATPSSGGTISERMRIDSSGNVGIGTSSPGAKLQVSGSTVSSNFAFGTTTAAAGQIASDTGYAGARVVFYGSTSGGGGTLDMYAGGTAPIQFNTNGSERMRIDSSGNVGIGFSSGLGTYGQLEVGGSTNPTIALRSSSASGTVFAITSVGATEARINAITNVPLTLFTNNTEKMRIDTSGNVLVGLTTSPTIGTNVTNNLVIPNDIAVGSLLIGTNSSFLGRRSSDGSTILNTGQANIIFSRGVYGSTTTSMTIDSNGNVIAGASAALATTATNGFLYVPTCAGTPTGTPTTVTGMAPIVVNTTNNKLYFYSGGAWRDAGP